MMLSRGCAKRSKDITIITRDHHYNVRGSDNHWSSCLAKFLPPLLFIPFHIIHHWSQNFLKLCTNMWNDLQPNKFCILGRKCSFKNQSEIDITSVLCTQFLNCIFFFIFSLHMQKCTTIFWGCWYDDYTGVSNDDYDGDDHDHDHTDNDYDG